MDQVFGTSPKVTNNPYSNLSPAQSQLQQLLTELSSQYAPGMFANVAGGNAAVPYSGRFAAPLTGDTTQLISDIMGTVGAGGQAHDVLNTAQGTLDKILSGTPQDYSKYFQDTIAAPAEQTFSQQTLPALKAAFARSAGGTNTVGANTGYSSAVGQATQALETALTGAQTSLGTQAVTQANNNMVSGLSMAPGLSSQFLQNYLGAIGPSAMPQQVQQTELAGQYGQYANSLNFLNSFFGQGGSLASAPTEQMNTVVTPGSPGYIGYLMAGFGSAIGKMA